MDHLDREIEEAMAEAERVIDEMTSMTAQYDQLEARMEELIRAQERVAARLERLLEQRDATT